ncbi:hypothetical protein FACS1894163_08030 [Spirochaetia bacterium]|nr:hypothetical protein FACS1894163_08030 [Spirochaetia bacterium]
MRKAFCAMALLLAMVVTTGLWAGGGKQPAASSGGPTPLSIAVSIHPTQTAPDWSLALGKLVQERTNTVITGEYWPESTVTEKQNLALASGTLPDLFFATRDQAFLYGQEGVFEPLDDLLAKNAPHILNYITPENSTVLKSPQDGKTYILPKYYQLNTLTETTFDYRKDILDEMKEPEPSTIDEWYNLFKRVKARYPNMVILSERNREVDMFTHTIFDMGKIDGYYGIIGSEYDKHKIEYLPITNEWRDMLAFYQKLYAEGLMDPEYLTIQYNDWWEGKIGGGRAFACWTMNFSRADQANQLAEKAGIKNVAWRVATTPKNYKTGERVQYQTGNPWQESGYALNAKSKVKTEAIKYLDYFFTEEYIAMASWHVDSPIYDALGYKNKRSMTEFEYNEYIGFNGFFNMPQLHPFVVVRNNNPPLDATVDHFDKNMPYVKIIPTIVRTGDSANWVSITTDLNAYIQTAMDEFITGKRPLSQWNAYVQGAKALKVDDGVKIVQGWYDNYWKSVGK